MYCKKGEEIEMDSIEEILRQSDIFVSLVNKIEIENEAAKRSREQLMESIEILQKKVAKDTEAYDIATHAIEILKGISDQTVQRAYGFLEESINDALEKMFLNSTRKIKIHEYLRDNKYPQLEIEVDTGNGIPMSLQTDSGHGIAQTVSILSLLCLIVLTGSRRILVIDEVLSGLSVENRKIITDIMWAFTDIGFQFLITEHGFIPRGAKVYHMELNGTVGSVKDEYIAESGVYLQGGENDNYDYSQVALQMIAQSKMKINEEMNGQGLNIREGGSNVIVI